MRTVYLESTIISYLTARPSRDLIVAGNQQLTQEWWEDRRSDFELYVSEIVIQEISAGDPDAATRRLAAVVDVPLLAVTEVVASLGRELLKDGAIPETSATDALHIAVAAVHGVAYLLTWNMAHIANAELRPRIERTCRNADFEPPILCTPAELMGG